MVHCYFSTKPLQKGGKLQTVQQLNDDPRAAALPSRYLRQLRDAAGLR